MPKQTGPGNNSKEGNNPILWSNLPPKELEKKIESVFPKEIIAKILKAKHDMERSHKGPREENSYKQLAEIDQMISAYKVCYEIIQNTRLQSMCVPPQKRHRWEDVAFSHCLNAILTNPNFAQLNAINGSIGISIMAQTMLDVLKSHEFKILDMDAIRESTATAFGFGSKTRPQDMRPHSKF
jgi:hypothetical protein